MISQSLIKIIDDCPLAVKKMLSGERTEPTEAMLCGLYFEHYLIGGCRGGKVPEFKALKNGNKPKAEQDLVLLIEAAKDIMAENDIVIDEVQPEYKYEDVVAHLDAVGSVGGEKCLIDVKWTATKAEDRWNGWGDILMKEDAHLQATHYVWTYLMAEGKKLPFYFIVFGKSGWVKLIRLDITDVALQRHEELINSTRMKLNNMNKEGFPAAENHAICHACWFKSNCDSFSKKLIIDKINLL